MDAGGRWSWGVKWGVKIMHDALERSFNRRICSMIFGAGEWTRTIDLLITNQLLYQLSYAGQGLPR